MTLKACNIGSVASCSRIRFHPHSFRLPVFRLVIFLSFQFEPVIFSTDWVKKRPDMSTFVDSCLAYKSQRPMWSAIISPSSFSSSFSKNSSGSYPLSWSKTKAQRQPPRYIHSIFCWLNVFFTKVINYGTENWGETLERFQNLFKSQYWTSLTPAVSLLIAPYLSYALICQFALLW